VIGAGRVLQSGTPRELFGQPRSPEVAALLGIENSHVGTVLDDATIVCDGVEIAAPTEGMEPGAPVGWAVDPERIVLSPDGPYAARVIDAIELGRRRELTLRVGSLELAVRGDQLHADVEDAVMLDIPADHISVWALGG
jgi:ABC-type Fe3+/spermidine/putrescine transport system ATPase subunit